MHSEGNYLETGKNDGILWAKTAHYDHLMYALHWTDLQNAGKDTILGGYFTEKLSLQPFLELDTYTNSEYLLNYLKGWKQGIEYFWAEIKELMSDLSPNCRPQTQKVISNLCTLRTSKIYSVLPPSNRDNIFILPYSCNSRSILILQVFPIT